MATTVKSIIYLVDRDIWAIKNPVDHVMSKGVVGGSSWDDNSGRRPTVALIRDDISRTS